MDHIAVGKWLIGLSLGGGVANYALMRWFTRKPRSKWAMILFSNWLPLLAAAAAFFLDYRLMMIPAMITQFGGNLVTFDRILKAGNNE